VKVKKKGKTISASSAASCKIRIGVFNREWTRRDANIGSFQIAFEMTCPKVERVDPAHGGPSPTRLNRLRSSGSTWSSFEDSVIWNVDLDSGRVSELAEGEFGAEVIGRDGERGDEFLAGLSFARVRLGRGRAT